MDEHSSEQSPVTNTSSVAVGSPRPAWTYIALPASIVLAAALIAGSIWLNKSANGESGTLAGPKTGTISYTIDDLKKWAGTVKGINKKEFATCLDSGKYETRVTQDRESGTALQVGGTPSFFINGVPLVGAQPISEFQRVIDQALSGPTIKAAGQQASAKDVPVTEQDHILGKTDATVTIIEYSDFQCPFCRNFFDQTYGGLKQQYIETGKVRLIYRHYPLSEIHPMAEKSAEAAECAGEQGKFWEMHDAIFAKQVS